jgi:hypothetical protein
MAHYIKDRSLITKGMLMVGDAYAAMVANIIQPPPADLTDLTKRLDAARKRLFDLESYIAARKQTH